MILFSFVFSLDTILLRGVWEFPLRRVYHTTMAHFMIQDRMYT